MDTNIFFIFVSIVSVALVSYLFWLDNRNLRLLKLRVKKLHASPLFKDLVPLLRIAQKRPIEHLTIDKTGIAIRYIEPAGSETRFVLAQHGYSPLSSEKQEALLVLMEEFLPKLADNHRYVRHKKRTRLMNGQFEIYHRYIILNRYKTSLIRAPYYDGSLQQLWQ